MELTELYKLRRSFTVVGLTGRTGSGCTKISELLSSDFKTLKKGFRKDEELIKSPILYKKFKICQQYLQYPQNWKRFEVIKYRDVLLFYLIMFYGKEPSNFKKLLLTYYTENKKTDSKREDNTQIVNKITKEIIDLLKKESIVQSICSLKGKIPLIKRSEKLKELHDLFFGDDFQRISKNIFSILEINGYFRRTVLLHHVSCNIRASGDPLNFGDKYNIKHIYVIAEIINRLIRAKKQVNDQKGTSTKIVIDSLRNSLEIMFFKERYSAFYMVATKDGKNRAKSRVKERLKKKLKNASNIEHLLNKMFELDAVEYGTKDHRKGHFASPDVYNCIQKSDVHLLNHKISELSEDNIFDFFSREEQILKLVSLIQQPGIITPSATERCMQMAFIAKLNSGCISRQVGAVVCDSNFSVKAVGWNDVPAGQTPCNLRNADDFFKGNLDQTHYSKFERGEDLDNVDINYKYKNFEPFDFPNALKSYFNNSLNSNKNDMNGKNCSFCFKTIHNHYEGEDNQVHTKSLHAEENAILQISKYGGHGLKGGILFSTASPCELCSKKASQLGINKIYFIDPYPGISEPHILTNNNLNKMKLFQFNGVIGKSYTKLFEPFMAYKDEVKIMLENKPTSFNNSDWKSLVDKNVTNSKLKEALSKYIDSDNRLDEDSLLSKLN